MTSLTELDERRAPVRSNHSTLLAIRSRFAIASKYLSLIFYSLVTVVPLCVIVFAALKSRPEYNSTGPFDLPRNWLNFHNFTLAFQQAHMLRGFVNTGVIMAISLTGTVIIGSMAAYALDRFEFRLKKTVVVMFLVATLVPSVTTQVTTFGIINHLGLLDTRWAAIALFLGTDIISIYIFMQFMRGIPKELDEAAMLDGANHLTVYWRIIFPLLKPAIATVVVIKGVAIYNEFYIPFLYMPSPGLGVISTSLFRFKGPTSAHWEVLSAGILLVILPTLILFLLLQRFIYNGFTSGATK